MEKTKQVIEWVRKFDQPVYRLVNEIAEEVTTSILLKYVVNCCLDISTSTKLSCVLANLMLDFDDQKQTFIIQNLISVCCRCYQPNLCEKTQ